MIFQNISDFPDFSLLWTMSLRKLQLTLAIFKPDITAQPHIVKVSYIFYYFLSIFLCCDSEIYCDNESYNFQTNVMILKSMVMYVFFGPGC